MKNNRFDFQDLMLFGTFVVTILTFIFTFN